MMDKMNLIISLLLTGLIWFSMFVVASLLFMILSPANYAYIEYFLIGFIGFLIVVVVVIVIALIDTIEDMMS